MLFLYNKYNYCIYAQLTGNEGVGSSANFTKFLIPIYSWTCMIVQMFKLIIM